jgi:hypothetical protein
MAAKKAAAPKAPTMPTAAQVKTAVSTAASTAKAVASIDTKIAAANKAGKSTASLEKQKAAAVVKQTAADTKLTTIVETAKTVASTTTANASKVISGELTGKAATTAVAQAKAASTNITAINTYLSTAKIDSVIADKVKPVVTTIKELVPEVRTTYFDAAVETATNRAQVSSLLRTELTLNLKDEGKTSKDIKTAVNNLNKDLGREAKFENQQVNEMLAAGVPKTQIADFKLEAARNPNTVQIFDKNSNAIATVTKDGVDVSAKDITLADISKTTGKETAVNIEGANPNVFEKIDPNTKLPILDQTALDKVLSKYGDNTLNLGQYRENYDQFGWNVKSDGSSVARGPAIYGVDKVKTNIGMGGQSEVIIAEAGTNKSISDNKLLSIAKQTLGTIDPATGNQVEPDLSKYYKNETVSSGGLGGTYTRTVLDRNALYNAINDQTKDMYLVSNALDRSGVYNKANTTSPHASILFKADGEGNLLPVVNQNTGEVVSQYYDATGVTHTGWRGQLAELAPVIQMASLVFAPGIGASLGSAIAGTAVGQAVGVAGSKVLGNAIVQASLSGTMAEAGGGNFGDAFGKAFLSNVAGPIASGIGGGILELAGVGPTQMKTITDAINSAGVKVTQEQVTNAFTQAIGTGLTSVAFDNENLVKNVTASLVGSAASAVTTNAVNSKLNDLVADGTISLDKPSVAALTTLTGNTAGLVGSNLVATGGDITKTGDILSNSIIPLLGSAKNAYEAVDKELRKETPIEERTTGVGGSITAQKQYQDAINAGFTEQEALALSGAAQQPTKGTQFGDLLAQLDTGTKTDAGTGFTQSELKKLPPVEVVGEKLGPLDTILANIQESFDKYIADPAANWLRNHEQIATFALDTAKKTGNSSVINTTANFAKAMGGVLGSFNGTVALFGKDPDSTAMGQFAKNLENLGKNANTPEYKAAVAEINKTFADAKGVSGVANALFGVLKNQPTTFLAETIGVEGMQEIAPLLIGGGAKLGAEAFATAFKLANKAKFSGLVGVSAAAASDVLESAGGEAASAYREAYDLAIKNKYTPEQANKYAAGIAQKTGLLAGAVTAATLGVGGNALAKQVLGYKGTGEQLSKIGSTIDELAARGKGVLKITGKEAGTEALEEGATQAFLETQLYKLDPTRDVSKNIALAATIGAISGGGVAGGVSSIEAASSLIATAQANNPEVQKILIANADNPAAAARELANIGIDNKSVQTNLINTVNNKNVITGSEAISILDSIPDYEYTQDDINNIVGVTNAPSERDAVFNYIKKSTGSDGVELDDNTGIVLSKNNETKKAYVIDNKNNIVEIDLTSDIGIGSIAPITATQGTTKTATVIAVDPVDNTAFVVDNSGNTLTINTSGSVTTGSNVIINNATNNVSDATTNQNVGAVTNNSNNPNVDAGVNAAVEAASNNNTTNTATNTATNTVTDASINTSIDTAANTAQNVEMVMTPYGAVSKSIANAFGPKNLLAAIRSGAVKTNTAVDPAVDTAVKTAVDPAVDTAVKTATDTATDTAVDTAVNTAVDTKTSVATDTLPGGVTTDTISGATTNDVIPEVTTPDQTASQEFPLTQQETEGTLEVPIKIPPKKPTPPPYVEPAKKQAEVPYVPGPSTAFYYGKEFGSPMQEITEEGLVQKPYQPLSVTMPGAIGETLETTPTLAAQGETEENAVAELIRSIMAEGGNINDLLAILKG